VYKLTSEVSNTCEKQELNARSEFIHFMSDKLIVSESNKIDGAIHLNFSSEEIK
jgi:hypothetical protein